MPIKKEIISETESTSSFETSVNFYQIRQRQILRDQNCHVCCYEKLNSDKAVLNLRYQHSFLGTQNARQRTVSWFGRLVTGPLLRRLGFGPTPLHVIFVVYILALGQVSLRVLSFYAPGTLPFNKCCIHIRPFITDDIYS
jgi:hypothetical protein